MSQTAMLQSVTYNVESSFCENATTFGTARSPRCAARRRSRSTNRLIRPELREVPAIGR